MSSKLQFLESRPGIASDLLPLGAVIAVVPTVPGSQNIAYTLLGEQTGTVAAVEGVTADPGENRKT